MKTRKINTLDVLISAYFVFVVVFVIFGAVWLFKPQLISRIISAPPCIELQGNEGKSIYLEEDSCIDINSNGEQISIWVYSDYIFSLESNGQNINATQKGEYWYEATATFDENSKVLVHGQRKYKLFRWYGSLTFKKSTQ